MPKKKIIKNPLTKSTNTANTLMRTRGSFWDELEYNKSGFKRYVAVKSVKVCIIGYRICLKRK